MAPPPAITPVAAVARSIDTADGTHSGLDPATRHRHIILVMATAFTSLSLAAALSLASVASAQAQQAGSTSPTNTAQMSARAASDAAQALDMAASPNGQPAPPLGPDGKLQQSGSNTAGLYDRHTPVAGAGNNNGFDPSAIHYPYGRYSLGNVDPSSAANPYSPYGSLPNTSFGAPPAGAPPGTFRGGLLLPGRH